MLDLLRAADGNVLIAVGLGWFHSYKFVPSRRIFVERSIEAVNVRIARGKGTDGTGRLTLLTNGEKYSIILGVDLAIRPERQWSVGRTNGLLQEDLPLHCPTLVEHVQASILAVRIHHPILVERGRVDAPFVASGMILVDGFVREFPFRFEIG